MDGKKGPPRVQIEPFARIPLLSGEIYQWYHPRMRRALTILVCLLIIATLPNWGILARPSTDENPPSWVFDLKTIGYPSHPSRDFVEAFGSHPSTIAFADSEHLVLTYISLDSGNLSEHLNRSLKLRLHAVVLDSRSGNIEIKRDWPTPSMSDGVVAAYNGKILLRRGDRLTLLTTSLDVFKDLDTNPSHDPNEYLSKVLTSSTGRHVLLKFSRRDGFEYIWMETENLQSGPSFSDKFWPSSISDEEIVGSRLEIPAREVLVFRKPDELGREIHFSRHYSREVVFLNQDSLAVVSGYPPIQVIQTDGTLSETIKPPAHDFFSRVTPSADGRRFAFSASSIRNMLEIFEPQMQWEYVKRVMVYDLSLHQFICNLKVRHAGRNDSFPLALATDGSSLAFFDGTVLTVYRLPHTYARPKFDSLDQSQPAVSSDAINQVDKLRAIVRDKQTQKREPKRVIAAITDLGNLRATSAIGDLIKVLTFRQTFDHEDEEEISLITPGNRFPAIEALFKIGMPALPALTKVVASSGSKSTRAQNAVYTVMVIFREHPEDGVAYLEEQASHARTSAGAARLKAGTAEGKRTWLAFSEMNINGAAMSDAVKQVAQTYRVVIGFQEVITPPYDKLVMIHIPKANVAFALNAIVEADPRYGWRQATDGSFRVFKKESTASLADVVVKVFNAKAQSWPELSELFDKTPEITAWLKDHKCSRGEAIVGNGVPPQDDGKKISLNADGKHFSEILDEVAKVRGAYYWSVVQFGQEPCRVSIRIE